jgi:hypothetical protein
MACSDKAHTSNERERTSENEYKGMGKVKASEERATLTLQRQGTHVERTSGQPLLSGAR